MACHASMPLTATTHRRSHQLLTHRLVPASHGAEERTRHPTACLRNAVGRNSGKTFPQCEPTRGQLGPLVRAVFRAAESEGGSDVPVGPANGGSRSAPPDNTLGNSRGVPPWNRETLLRDRSLSRGGSTSTRPRSTYA
jgi:hypothetical protein